MVGILNLFGAAVQQVPGLKSFFGASAEKDQKRIDRLLERFASTPMGAELLAVAKSMNIAFRLSDDIPDTEGGGYCASKRYIVLNKKLDDLVLISTLAHELRHVWQHAHMPYKFHLNDQPDETDVMGAIVFDRYLEADAFSFSHAFIEDFEQRMGPQGMLFAYEQKSAGLGLNIRSLRNASYPSKIDFYADALGRDGLNAYDHEVISRFSSYAEQHASPAVAGDPLLTPDMSAAAHAVEQLRDFDKPFMAIPAPFAHFETVQDFCDTRRLTLTEDVKENAAAVQKMFLSFFAKSLATKDAPKPHKNLALTRTS